METNPKIPPGTRASSCASTAFDGVLLCRQSPCKKKAVNRHGEATSTGDSFPRSYSCAMQDAWTAVNLLTLRAESKTPAFDLVLA